MVKIKNCKSLIHFCINQPKEQQSTKFQYSCLCGSVKKKVHHETVLGFAILSFCLYNYYSKIAVSKLSLNKLFPTIFMQFYCIFVDQQDFSDKPNITLFCNLKIMSTSNAFSLNLFWALNKFISPNFRNLDL